MKPLLILCVAALSANAWNLEGVRIGRIDIHGGGGTSESLVDFYSPRIKTTLQNAGVMATGDPNDFILHVAILRSCNANSVCSGMVDVSVSLLQQDQRLLVAWQRLEFFSGVPQSIEKTISDLTVDYLRNNQRQVIVNP